MALSARSTRRNALPLNLFKLEDRTVPTVTLPDWTVGKYPFGWLGGEDRTRVDLAPTHFVSNPNGYLTGPQAGTSEALAYQNLREWSAFFGLTPAETSAKYVGVSSGYADDGPTGLRHVYLEQRLNGLQVVNSSISLHYATDGRLSAVSGGFYPGLLALDTGGQLTAPSVSAVAAVVEASYQVGFDVTVSAPVVTSPASGPEQTTILSSPEASKGPITAKRAYVYSAAAGSLRPVWMVGLETRDGRSYYEAGVDTQTGEVLYTANLIDNHAAYNALQYNNEAPGDRSGPPSPYRTFEVGPNDPRFSPYGWHDTDGKAGAEYTDTRGNNVEARIDPQNTNPDYTTTGGRPDGGAGLLFDNTLDLTQNYANSPDALVTNMFYMTNALHDIHAVYGFTEQAGNFQQLNYSGSGLGGDGVLADAIDGGGTDNANFFTPVDGKNPRMQMYRYVTVTPNRSAEMENGTIIHEYGHGVTNRLTGGPANSVALNARQSGGMGEGWSDWYEQMITQWPGDKSGDRNPSGWWELGQNQNTGTGVRRVAYSYDLAQDPHTWAVYNADSTGEVHNTGEIWTSALWDMNWLFIFKYGYDNDLTTGYKKDGSVAEQAGNKLALQLVMDALKIQPANPTFIQARDAILQADVNLTGGVNRREIWAAFTRRGLGAGASTAGADQFGANAVTTSFNMPNEAKNPGITQVTPPGRSGTAPGSIALTFSEAMNPASFDKTDINSFTGPNGVNLLQSVTGFTWSVGNTVLTITFAPPAGDAAQGKYALTVGPNITAADDGSQLDQNLDGTAGDLLKDTFTATFAYDQVQLAVASFSPAAGTPVASDQGYVDVKFTEPVAAASVTKDDLMVSGADNLVTGASVQADGVTVRFTLATLPTGPLYLQVKQGVVADPFGFTNTTARSTLTVLATNKTVPLPPLTPYAPLGSLTYQTPHPHPRRAGRPGPVSVHHHPRARPDAQRADQAGLRADPAGDGPRPGRVGRQHPGGE